MPNLHTPERGENETRKAYIARRTASNCATREAQKACQGGKLTMRQIMRDKLRENGALIAGTFGQALRNLITAGAGKFPAKKAR